jgi:hypothetical protein
MYKTKAGFTGLFIVNAFCLSVHELFERVASMAALPILLLPV